MPFINTLLVIKIIKIVLFKIIVIIVFTKWDWRCCWCSFVIIFRIFIKRLPYFIYVFHNTQTDKKEVCDVFLYLHGVLRIFNPIQFIKIYSKPTLHRFTVRAINHRNNLPSWEHRLYYMITLHIYLLSGFNSTAITSKYTVSESSMSKSMGPNAPCLYPQGPIPSCLYPSGPNRVCPNPLYSPKPGSWYRIGPRKRQKGNTN